MKQLALAVAWAWALGLPVVAMAAATPEDTANVLNSVIEIAKDGQMGYETAAGSAKDADLKQMFSKYSDQRAQFVEELQGQVAQLGTAPQDTGTTGGAAHRGWINLKSAVTQGDAAILAEVERGEEAAVKAYEDALAKDLPADARNVLQKQHAAIKSILNEVQEQHAELKNRPASES
jgi:uncharacterized protein (TIGR02284 family)